MTYEQAVAWLEKQAVEYWDPHANVAKRVLAVLEREHEEAERYRWLRANAQWMYPSSEGSDQKHAYLTVTGYGDCFHDPRAGEIIDAAIDAVRKP